MMTTKKRNWFVIICNTLLIIVILGILTMASIGAIINQNRIKELKIILNDKEYVMSMELEPDVYSVMATTNGTIVTYSISNGCTTIDIYTRWKSVKQ